MRRSPDAVLAPGQLTVAGGHLEAGELLAQAGRRETEEETEIRVSADAYFGWASQVRAVMLGTNRYSP
ncbi:NUDIX domain-containing protein [Streptomyces sp. NPDC002523]